MSFVGELRLLAVTLLLPIPGNEQGQFENLRPARQLRAEPDVPSGGEERLVLGRLC